MAKSLHTGGAAVKDRRERSQMDRPWKAEKDPTVAAEVISALEVWDQSPVAIAAVIPILDVGQSIVQVFHPWPKNSGYISWSDMATRTGLRRSRLWPTKSLAEYADAAVDVTGGPTPYQGRLERHIAEALANDLTFATTTPDDVLYLIWDGWSDVSYDRWLSAARVNTPHRTSILLRGPLNGIAENLAGPDDPPGHFGALLCWPVDRSWVMATEVDLPFTYVAGSENLAQRLLADTRLETARARPNDRVTLVPD